MELEMTSEQADIVIPAALEFQSIVTESLGLEQGLKFNEALLNAVSADVRGQVLFAQLTGSYTSSGVIVKKFSGTHPEFQSVRVAAIKLIREYSGLGLKEALDLINALAVAPQTVTIQKSAKQSLSQRRREFQSKIRQLGFEA
jgi:ribosomal protein L7/L12